jgi:hypothetical protein
MILTLPCLTRPDGSRPAAGAIAGAERDEHHLIRLRKFDIMSALLYLLE